MTILYIVEVIINTWEVADSIYIIFSFYREGIFQVKDYLFFANSYLILVNTSLLTKVKWGSSSIIVVNFSFNRAERVSRLISRYKHINYLIVIEYSSCTTSTFT